MSKIKMIHFFTRLVTVNIIDAHSPNFSEGRGESVHGLTRNRYSTINKICTKKIIMRQVHTGEDCQIAALVPDLLGQACVVTHGKSSNLKLEAISGV